MADILPKNEGQDESRCHTCGVVAARGVAGITGVCMRASGDYLLTRVMAPSLQAGTLRRERLIRKLDEASRCPVTLVVAPAGFGKTVLVQSWLAERPQGATPCAWASLENGAGDPLVFLGYLVRALERAGLATDCRTAQMLSRVNPPSADEAAASLINDIASLEGKVVLVLDDFHTASSEQVDDLALFLANNQPPNLHCLILTRVAPHWPLASMAAYGKLATIAQDDLRFTGAELQQLARNTTFGEIDELEAQELVGATEGWPAALRLCLARGRRLGRLPETVRAKTPGGLGCARPVVDSLLDEFLDGAQADVRKFLRATAPVENLCPELCARLLAGASPACAPSPSEIAETVERISRDGLQVTSVDAGNGVWFRYHHLLRSRIMARLRAEGVDTAQTYRRASEWFEEQGVVCEQVRYAIASRDWAFASDAVLRSALWAILTGRFSVLRDWMAGIPERETLQHPALCFAAALVPSLSGSYARRAQVASMCGRLEEFAHPNDGCHEAGSEPFDSEASCEGLACLLRANLFMVPDPSLDPNEHLALALRAQRLLGGGSPLAGPIYQHIGCAELALGMYDEAREAFEEGLRRAGENDDVCVTAETGAFLVDLYVEQGRDAEALEQIQQLKERAATLVGAGEDETEAPPVLGVLDIMHGRVLLERGRPQEAERLIERGIALSHGSCVPYFTMMGDIELARARFAVGHAPEAAAALDSLGESWGELRFVVDALRGELPAQAGDEREASSAISRAMRTAADNLAPGAMPCVGFSGGAQARWEATIAALRTVARLGDAGQLAESLPLIDSARAHYEQCGLVGRAEKLKQVRALMCDRMGRATSPGWGVGACCAETEAGTPVQLTERELEVLRLAAEGLSNQEISNRLVIAVTTTKSHMAHAMQKLNAPNRTTAVALARKYGLIE